MILRSRYFLNLKRRIGSNKNKGFTLIEMLVVIGIIATFLSFSLINFGAYRKLTNKVDSEIFSNSLLNFINNSKEYCRDNGSGGYIYFNCDNDVITFNCGLKEIYRLPLPEGFEMNKVRDDNKIQIDNRGITADACTINFKDREGTMHSMGMGVGTAYVEIKN